MITAVTPSRIKKITSWSSRSELPWSDRMIVPRSRPAVEMTMKSRVLMWERPRM
jgi:hypothetical protein